jgi:hypothetical protein
MKACNNPVQPCFADARLCISVPRARLPLPVAERSASYESTYIPSRVPGSDTTCNCDILVISYSNLTSLRLSDELSEVDRRYKYFQTTLTPIRHIYLIAWSCKSAALKAYQKLAQCIYTASLYVLFGMSNFFSMVNGVCIIIVEGDIFQSK